MDTKKDLILRPQSGISTTVNRINDISQHPAILSDLSYSIKKAVDKPSFSQLITQGANVKETQQVLAVLISKYANMLTVGGNLRPEHPMQYAESVMRDNPGMSLDDFNILLDNGVKGRYNEPGKLFRFDITVLYEWISKYLDQYWEIKDSMPKQKSALEMLPDEDLAKVQEIIAQAPDRIVLPLTEDEIKREGQEKPVKPVYVPPDQSYLRMIELKAEYGRTHCDLHTGKKLPDSPDFDTWLNEK